MNSMQPMGSKRHNLYDSKFLRPLAIYVIPPVILVLLGFTLFSSTGRDDAYITYWPAHTLSHFGEMLNYNGDRIEQSSSMLHVIVLALANKVSGIEVEVLGPWSSIVFGVMGVIAVYKLALKVEPSTAFFAALLTGTAAYYVYWSFGGLETTLVSVVVINLILAYGMYLNVDRPQRITIIWTIISTLLAILVRPEMPIVLICMVIGAMGVVIVRRILLTNDESVEYRVFLFRVLSLLTISVVVSGLVTLFRIGYFNSPFPQPVIAKSGHLNLSENFDSGFTYLKENLTVSRVLTSITLVSVSGMIYGLWVLITRKSVNPYLLFSLLFVIVYISFIALSAGDWMEVGRFVAPMLPIMLVFIPYFVGRAVRNRGVQIAVLSVLVLFQCKTIYNVSGNSTGMPVWNGIAFYNGFGLDYGARDYSWFERTNRIHLRDIPTILYLDYAVAQLLPHKEGKVSIMSGQMGMVSYYTAKKYFGDVQFIDTHALIEDTFTDCPMTSRLPRSTSGVELGDVDFFQYPEDVERYCGVPLPDIIFGLGGGPASASADYTVLYQQEGIIPGSSGWFSGRNHVVSHYIAVKNDWTLFLDESDTITLTFADLLPENYR